MSVPVHRLQFVSGILLLTVVVAAAWAGALEGPFVLDDLPSVVESPNVREPAGWLAAAWAPAGSGANARPLVALSLAANHALGGLATRGYHLVNVGAHLACALALFALARRRAGAWFAAATASLWAAHPLVTDAVNPAIGRNEVFVALFGVACIAALEAGLAREERGTAARGCFALSIVAAFAAALSKEVAVCVPVLAVLWVAATRGIGLVRVLRARRGFFAALFAATWLPLAALTAAGERGASVGFDLPGVSPLAYLRTQGGVVLHYARLALWPRGLSADHGDWPIARELSDWLPQAVLVGLLLVASLAALLRGKRESVRVAGFLGCAWFLWLAPSSSVVPLAGDVAAEHRAYLPVAAIVFLVALGASALARTVVARRVLLVLWLAALGGAVATTRARNALWQDSISLWRDATVKRPANARAWNSLGVALAAEGDDAAAENAYRRVLVLDPGHAKAHHNLANLLTRTGRVDEATALRDRAADLAPDSFEALLNRGELRIAAGRGREGLADLERAFALAPERVATRARLAWHLATIADEALRDPVRALALCEEARGAAATAPRIAEARAAARAALGR